MTDDDLRAIEERHREFFLDVDYVDLQESWRIARTDIPALVAALREEREAHVETAKRASKLDAERTDLEYEVERLKNLFGLIEEGHDGWSLSDMGLWPLLGQRRSRRQEDAILTFPERLRAAAAAERLADWVRVSHLDGSVRWRKGEKLLFLLRQRDRGWGAYDPAPGSQVFTGDLLSHSSGLKRDAAIRAGLLALAEREEARG